MKLLLYILLLIPTFTFAKKIEIDTFLVRKENDLALLLDKLRKSKDNAELDYNNLNFEAELKEVLEAPGILDYPFDKLNTMSTIKSPDGVFRVFNWNIENENQIHSHFCYLVKKGRGSKNQIIKFKEDKFTLGPRPDGMLTPNRWYGGLYYKIVPIEVGRKTMYTMFAYNGGNRSSNKKILDVFWFKGRSLRLGYPIFQDERNEEELHRRVFFEFSEKASISMKYDERINKIIFDHLVPEAGNLKGMYEYYIPDMEFDAYFWQNNFWNYQANIIVGNEKEKSRREYYIDEETGEELFKIVPVGFVNPTRDGSNMEHEIENDNLTEKEKKKLIKKRGRAKYKADKLADKNMSKDQKRQIKLIKKQAKENKSRSSFHN
jgi:hypothetical protein